MGHGVLHPLCPPWSLISGLCRELALGSEFVGDDQWLLATACEPRQRRGSPPTVRRTGMP